jgi:hypothetical protein
MKSWRDEEDKLRCHSLLPSPVKTCHGVLIFLLPSLPSGKLRGLDIAQSSLNYFILFFLRSVLNYWLSTYIYIDDDLFRKRLAAGGYPQNQISIKIDFWLVVAG